MHEVISWTDFEFYMSRLIKMIGNKIASPKGENLVGVYGPPRGGLIPAVCISHTFNLPLLLHPVDNCILVDDIYDSGATINAITQYCTPSIIGLLVKRGKPESNNFIVAHYEDSKKWIKFPWELC